MTQTNTRGEQAERLLTVRELADQWKCCTRTVSRKIDRGEIEVVRLSDNMVRIRESVAEKHVAERTIRKSA
jgi:excisionase family DNA binding protein